MILSDRVKEEKLIVIDKIELKEFKTKAAEVILKNLKINDKVLIVLGKPTIQLRKSFHNLSQAQLISVQQLNVFDLLNHVFVLMDEAALKLISDYCKE